VRFYSETIFSTCISTLKLKHLKSAFNRPNQLSADTISLHLSRESQIRKFVPEPAKAPKVRQKMAPGRARMRNSMERCK
jgi:hypothetical protein